MNSESRAADNMTANDIHWNKHLGAGLDQFNDRTRKHSLRKTGPAQAEHKDVAAWTPLVVWSRGSMITTLDLLSRVFTSD